MVEVAGNNYHMEHAVSHNDLFVLTLVQILPYAHFIVFFKEHLSAAHVV